MKLLTYYIILDKLEIFPQGYNATLNTLKLFTLH